MPALDTATVERLATQFFRGEQGSLSDLAAPYSIDDLIRAFENLRHGMWRILNRLSEEQIAFSPDPNTYSLSEVVSHLVAAQGNTYNAFLDLGGSTLPHVDPVPRTPGGGAEKGLTSTILQERLQKGTDGLITVLKQVYTGDDAKKVKHFLFGDLTYKGWMLFQVAHDLDHLKQAQVLRRSPGFPYGPAAGESTVDKKEPGAGSPTPLA